VRLLRAVGIHVDGSDRTGQLLVRRRCDARSA